MKALRLFALALALTLALCAGAQAELSAKGDLLVSFSGGISPNALPRSERAPIAVSVQSAVKTFSGERPPALRQITIALNNGGRLDTKGLPRCRQGQIETATSAEALAICGPAQLGGGSYAADIAFPEQGAFPSKGKIIAFNAVVDGKRAILAHIFGGEPAPTSRIVVFDIRQSAGTFGTVLTGSFPESSNRYGYVTHISLSLHRNFTYRGHRHSYLSAGCAAPAGFSGAVFPFARVSMSFSDGRTLSSTMTRSCKVRAGS